MISFAGVSIIYDGAVVPVLRDVTLSIGEGELVLVAGPTGSGKSTLLRAINGLVPHFTGGTLIGRVSVHGMDTAAHQPRDFAEAVGYVGQDPLAGFVTDTVEEELAYAMEQLAVPSQTMRKRVEETLDLLGIAGLRDRALRTLSGGQQQRVAIGSVLTGGARILVLDEPTSALDPTSAEEVIAAMVRLVHDLGVTVVIAEHRMERVVEYADRVVLVGLDGTVTDGLPEPMMAGSPIAPAVVRLGRVAGWSPLPLSVRDARRQAVELRNSLGEPGKEPRALPSVTAPLLTAKKVTVRYGSHTAVAAVSLTVAAGDVVALMGRNGSGKSSLLWALTGVGPRQAGSVLVGGTETKGLKSGMARQLIGMVPQSAADLLYLDTVAAECAAADQESGACPGTCALLLDSIVPGLDQQSHPRDLSEGQRLGLVLAVQLTAQAPVLLLDEPTRGLDYRAKENLAAVLKGLAARGSGIVIATHDVEFVADVASRVLVMATGEIVADGRAADVIASSPAFAPQVAKVLAPAAWLTVDQVAGALQSRGARGQDADHE